MPSTSHSWLARPRAWSGTWTPLTIWLFWESRPETKKSWWPRIKISCWLPFKDRKPRETKETMKIDICLLLFPSIFLHCQIVANIPNFILNYNLKRVHEPNLNIFLSHTDPHFSRIQRSAQCSLPLRGQFSYPSSPRILRPALQKFKTILEFSQCPQRPQWGYSGLCSNYIHRLR